MKRFLFITLLLSSATCFGQKVKLDTVKWMSDNLGGLSFDKGRVTLNFDGIKRQKGYQISNDTLIMRNEHIVDTMGKRVKYIDLFKFKIHHADDRTLKLSPINANARAIANKKAYTFHNLSYLRDADVKFTSVAFTSGPCPRNCPVLRIDIDQAGNYKVLGQTGNGGRSAGPISGTLTKPEMDKLNYLIQHSQLKKMKSWKQKHAIRDVASYLITVAQGKQETSIYTNVPPLNIQPLIDYMLTFDQRLPLLKKATQL